MAYRLLREGLVRKRSLLLAVLLPLLTQTTACLMSPHAARGVARAAFVSAIVAANVAMLASHDAHYHGYGCGHHYRWHDGRVVYYYGGHWEYYDDRAGAWYYYAD